MRRVRARLLVAAALVGPAAVVSAQGEAPVLHFGLTRTGPAASPPAQVVFVESPPGAPIAWSASTDRAWLRVDPRDGRSPARVRVSIDASALAADLPFPRGAVHFRMAGGQPDRTIDVAVQVVDGNGAPIGAVDAPADPIFLDAPVALAGWALDDIGVTEVEICRDGAASPDAVPCRGDPGAVRIGRAAFAPGTRPDVAAAYPGVPQSDRASWSYALDAHALDVGGVRRIRMRAIASDVEGHATVLGQRLVVLPRVSLLADAFTRRAVVLVGALFALFAGLQTAVWHRMAHPSIASSSEPRRVQPVHAWEAAALGLIVIGFLALHVPRLDRSLVYDELVTASNFIVDVPLWKTMTSNVVFNNHYGYSLAGVMATRVFGAAEWAIRLPALVFGALALVGVWLFARATSTRSVAVVSAGLLALSPFFGEWAETARGYTGLAACGLLSALAFFRLLERPSPRWAIFHWAVTSMAVYLQMYGVWMVVVQYTLYAWLRLRRSGDLTSGRLLWLSFTGIAATLALLYGPIVRDILVTTSMRGRRVAVDTRLPLDLLRALAGSDDVVPMVLTAIVASVGLTLWRRRESAFALALILLPLSTMVLVARPLDLYQRFFVYWAPWFAIAVAQGVCGMVAWLTKTRTGLVRAAGVAIVLSAAALGSWSLLVASATHRGVGADDYRLWVRSTLPARPAARFVIGDGTMLDYYAGRPLVLLQSMAELEMVLRNPAPAQVLVNDVPWNTPADAAMQALLERRCTSATRAVIRGFDCP